MDVFTRGSADETWNWIMRKTVNGSVQKWNHPLKTVETKTWWTKQRDSRIWENFWLQCQKNSGYM
jgi:hypothetical protein